jgi:hypothetical protein
MALAQAHGSPGESRGAAPRWYSTRTPVTARHYRTASRTDPTTVIDKIAWLRLADGKILGTRSRDKDCTATAS